MIDINPLLKWLTEHNVTDEELNSRIGVRIDFIRNAIKRKRTPKLSTLYKIGEIYGLALSDMITFTDENGEMPVLTDRPKKITKREQEIVDKAIALSLITSPPQKVVEKVEVIKEVVKEVNKGIEIKEPDYAELSLTFATRFKEKYKTVPKSYEDYINFMMLAYKQGCKEMFKIVTSQIPEDRKL